MSHSKFTLLTTFEYSTEAQLVKSKLESEGIVTMLKDEATIDSDPLISQAIGGVKLYVRNDYADWALDIYNEMRLYEKDKKGNAIACVECNSKRILVAPPKEGNFLWMLFPFFEKKRYICNDCQTIFRKIE